MCECLRGHNAHTSPSYCHQSISEVTQATRDVTVWNEKRKQEVTAIYCPAEKKEADFIIYCELFSDTGKVGRLRRKILDQSVNEECS